MKLQFAAIEWFQLDALSAPGSDLYVLLNSSHLPGNSSHFGEDSSHLSEDSAHLVALRKRILGGAADKPK